jgi:hypothetical protein
MLAALVAMESGEAALTALFGAPGAVAGVVGTIGTVVGHAMRQAGLKSVDSLVTDAMLNPELARVLLTKLPAHNPSIIAADAVNKIKALGMVAAGGDLATRHAPDGNAQMMARMLQQGRGPASPGVQATAAQLMR